GRAKGACGATRSRRTPRSLPRRGRGSAVRPVRRTRATSRHCWQAGPNDRRRSAHPRARQQDPEVRPLAPTAPHAPPGAGVRRRRGPRGRRRLGRRSRADPAPGPRRRVGRGGLRGDAPARPRAGGAHRRPGAVRRPDRRRLAPGRAGGLPVSGPAAAGDPVAPLPDRGPAARPRQSRHAAADRRRGRGLRRLRLPGRGRSVQSENRPRRDGRPLPGPAARVGRGRVGRHRRRRRAAGAGRRRRGGPLRRRRLDPTGRPDRRFGGDRGQHRNPRPGDHLGRRAPGRRGGIAQRRRRRQRSPFRGQPPASPRAAPERPAGTGRRRRHAGL
ncbi:MAG: hypothetical protein AVDCRST_MAG73-3215, partial [uncultured Thermomicrobiales bacterium]